MSRQKCDVVALTETWLKRKHNLQSLLGDIFSFYEEIRCDRPRKKGGGVIFLLKRSLFPVTVYAESVSDGYEIVSCDVSSRGYRYRLILVYRTPKCSAELNLQLVKCISDLSSSNNPCLLMGDFNYPDINWHDAVSSSSSLANDFLQMLSNHGFSQYVNLSTRGNHALDLLFCNEEGIIDKVSVAPPLGSSDHASIHFVLDGPQSSHKFAYSRDFRNVNVAGMTAYLDSVDWLGVFNCCLSVNEMYETFLFILKHCLDLFVILKRVPFSFEHIPHYLRHWFRLKENAYRKASGSDLDEDWTYYKRISDKFNKKLFRFNCSIEKKILSSNNKAALYRYVNNRIKRKEGIGFLRSFDGSILTSDRDRAELLAGVFETVYQDSDPGEPPSCEGMSFPKMADSVWFDRHEIYSLLSRWPTCSSNTPDGIPFKFIKLTSACISSPLEYLFNLIFFRAEVPKRWRHAFVTPLKKKSPAYDPSNYRPISITSLFCRIFEKIIKKKIELHLKEHDILPCCQHGFRKGKSTETQMLESLNEWTFAMDLKRSIDVIYLDFQKAFDKVPHDLLLLKLEQVGIHHRFIAWIRSFLSQRTFQVIVDGGSSSVRCACSGVPQGGVLSPLLFSIYVYDLPGVVVGDTIKCKMFADDVKIFGEPGSSLQASIDAILRWSSCWKLPLSAIKSRILHLGRNNPHLSYSMRGEPLIETDTVRDLGFIIDRNLSFKEHCHCIVNNAEVRLFHLFKSFCSIDPFPLIEAYKL
ncbi:hypothetical protein V3C99_008428 [Haemonchus contortus]